MKSVLFISLMNGSAWGGSEEAWFRTALWMSRNNYNIAVCCFAWEDKQVQINRLKASGCKVYQLPDKKRLFKNREIKKVLYSIPFNQYDLVFVNQGGWEEILHAPFKYLYKKLPEYVLVNHNYNENAELPVKKQKLLQQWINGAAMNFGATQKIFDVIEKRFHINIEKKATLINPITFEADKEPNPYPALTEEPCTWVMLAELDTARKSQHILIEALSSSKWAARNWQLHLYGKGRDKEMLEKLIKQAGLENKVHLKGFTNDIKQTLQHCHLLLQCTAIDAMPISVVEAMAMARPCIVSKVGDMPVWIEDGVNGFVCNAVTPEAIEQALEHCWLQKNNWELLGKKAFASFIKKYPQPYEEKIADILNSFIP